MSTLLTLLVIVLTFCTTGQAARLKRSPMEEDIPALIVDVETVLTRDDFSNVVRSSNLSPEIRQFLLVTFDTLDENQDEILEEEELRTAVNGLVQVNHVLDSLSGAVTRDDYGDIWSVLSYLNFNHRLTVLMILDKVRLLLDHKWK